MTKGKDDGPFRRPATVQQYFSARVPVGKEDLVVDRPGEIVDDPLADVDSNELRAGVETTCPVGDHAILAGVAVRRRADGSYQHDVCR